AAAEQGQDPAPTTTATVVRTLLGARTARAQGRHERRPPAAGTPAAAAGGYRPAGAANAFQFATRCLPAGTAHPGGRRRPHRRHGVGADPYCPPASGRDRTARRQPAAAVAARGV